MPDFGILEGLSALTSAFGLEGGLGALLGFGGDAAAAGAGAGAAGLATGAGDLGALGTAQAFMGAGGFDALAGGVGAGAGADLFSTAGSYLLAPGVSGGFGAGADALLAGAAGSGLASGTGGLGAGSPIEALLGATPTAGFGTQAVGSASSALSPTTANANASASVFDTGASPLSGLTPSQSAGTGAAGVAAPGGVTPAGGVDPTAAAATPGGTPAGGAQAGGGSISDLLGRASGGLMDSVTKNPLGVGLGAAGLGYNILQGQKSTANQDALRATATTAAGASQDLARQGAALEQYLTNGTLPPNYQKIVDDAIRDAKTTAISNAAAQGLPTDPTKNTALAATLARIDSSRAGMQTQVASQLFQSGSGLVSQGQTAAGLSGQLFQALVNNDTAQAKSTGAAIATLAAALNGRQQTKVGNTNISLSQG